MSFPHVYKHIYWQQSLSKEGVEQEMVNDMHPHTSWRPFGIYFSDLKTQHRECTHVQCSLFSSSSSWGSVHQSPELIFFSVQYQEGQTFFVSNPKCLINEEPVCCVQGWIHWRDKTVKHSILRFLCLRSSLQLLQLPANNHWLVQNSRLSSDLNGGVHGCFLVFCFFFL